MSSDDEFEDTYGDIADEKAVEPLEVENTAIIQATMPSGNENKPNKSICKALSTHLGLLKHKVSEISTYLDDREAVQTIGDHEIDTIQLRSNWIEAKSNKILAQWEDFLDTDYDEAEHARAEPTYNECDDLSSRIRNRADKFIREKGSRTAQSASSGQVIQTSSYNGPPRTNDMLKPKKLLEENMSLEAALHWFKTYKNHLDLNKVMLAQQSIEVRRGILENDIDPHMANALGAHPNVKDDTSIDDCLNILKEIFMEKNPIWVRRKMWFECIQKDNESVTQWWNRKLEIAKQCDLEHMKREELAMLQFMMGIN